MCLQSLEYSLKKRKSRVYNVLVKIGDDYRFTRHADTLIRSRTVEMVQDIVLQ